jgi:DnaK suppressor protein
MDRYHEQLLTKREELVRDVEEVRSRSAHDTDEEDKDYIDYAVSSYTKEFLYSLSDLERKQLLLVDKAIRTIEEETYGTCEECGEEIEEKRLNAVPWATHCLTCQELADRGLLKARAEAEEEEEE